MRQYILKRILLFVPTIFGVSLLIFTILRILPGDVAMLILQGNDPDKIVSEEQLTELRTQLGLDRPIHLQYIQWVWGVIRFDLGISHETGIAVLDLIKKQFPVTAQLAAVSIVLVTLVALPVGVFAALYQDKWPDYVLRGLAILALAMPGFFLAIVVVLILSRGFGWLPPLGFSNVWDRPWDSVRQLAFPALILGLHGAGTLLRITRAQMLEVIREDYIRTARAKGLMERVIVVRHALRNALIPVVTLLGGQVATLLGGTVVIESVFSLPGLGQELVRAVFVRDVQVVQTYTLYLVIVSLIVNLLVDLSYTVLDPRIRYS